MKCLLDTHAFLWFILEDERLSQTAYSMICNPLNEVLVSPASLWELAIKISIGKFTLETNDIPGFFQRQLQLNRFELLPIAISHLGIVASLPFLHRDPLNRLIIAQALHENVDVVSAHAAFDGYPIKRVW